MPLASSFALVVMQRPAASSLWRDSSLGDSLGDSLGGSLGGSLTAAASVAASAAASAAAMAASAPPSAEERRCLVRSFVQLRWEP